MHKKVRQTPHSKVTDQNATQRKLQKEEAYMHFYNPKTIHQIQNKTHFEHTFNFQLF